MKKIALLAVLLTTIVSCKKYPEGPSFSLISRSERLANTWKIAKVLEDGVDKTSDYQSAFKDYAATVDKAGTYSLSYKILGLLSYSENGNWSFNDDQSMVTFDPTSNNNSNWDVKILKLKEDELWFLDEDNNGKKIEYHFQP